jgi:prepilin peptidase CpaA
MFTVPPWSVQALLLTLVIGAAVFDVRYRRIPNWLTVTGALLGIALNTLVYPFPGGLIFAFKGLGLGFGVYFVLYALHAMGAGDAKLMAAVGAMVGWVDWLGIFAITAIVGGVMAVIVVVARKRVKTTFWNMNFILTEMKAGRAAHTGREELDVRNPKAMGLPHGAVIAVGTLFFLAFAARFAH